jgi:hypothetical protein
MSDPTQPNPEHPKASRQKISPLNSQTLAGI